jgi:hypothetical protein
VNNRKGHIRSYLPALAVLSMMVFIFVYSTLPSLEMNRYLNRVKNERIEDIRALQRAEDRIDKLNKALDSDPTTVENYLRRRFGQAKRSGEVEIDQRSR